MDVPTSQVSVSATLGRRLSLPNGPERRLSDAWTVAYTASVPQANLATAEAAVVEAATNDAARASFATSLKNSLIAEGVDAAQLEEDFEIQQFSMPTTDGANTPQVERQVIIQEESEEVSMGIIVLLVLMSVLVICCCFAVIALSVKFHQHRQEHQEVLMTRALQDHTLDEGAERHSLEDACKDGFSVSDVDLVPEDGWDLEATDIEETVNNVPDPTHGAVFGATGKMVGPGSDSRIQATQNARLLDHEHVAL